MATNITTASATTISPCGAIFIQFNAALTGSVTVTAGGVLQGTITNPLAGNTFRYGNLSALKPVVVTPSTTCDISVTAMSRLVG